MSFMMRISKRIPGRGVPLGGLPFRVGAPGGRERENAKSGKDRSLCCVYTLSGGCPKPFFSSSALLMERSCNV